MRALNAGMTARPRAEDGFTVVEALIATFVLLAGLLSVIGVFDDSRDQNATGERSEIALLQAEQALEEMRGIPYNRLLLDAGVVDPGTNRVTNAGAKFQVKPDLSEQLVYYSSEGVPQANAWVTPTSTVRIGLASVPLNMTIHRFVTWRDEECRVVDPQLGGFNLPAAIDEAQTSLGNLINTVLNNLLGILGGSDRQLVQNLRSRLIGFQLALNQREAEIGSALAGISELDLCDVNLTVLNEVQRLERLVPAMTAAGALIDRLQALESAFGGICLPIVGCLLNQAHKDAIASVNSQLDCIFGTGSQNPQFDAYLNGILGGLQNIAGDVSDTEKNSKRITVAVVVEPRKGVGPAEPVWASSVVRDPSAGLVSSGGSPCL